uniref:Mitochondrial import inner membrane translocase subunit Tim8 B n=2 Tax=Callithrix jacchus TaxID=9483 RepID=A0A8I3W4C3_CALJA
MSPHLHPLPRLEAALSPSGCEEPSPRPPWAQQRALSLQRTAISFLRAQGHSPTRKQLGDNSHSRRRKKTGRRKMLGEPEVERRVHPSRMRKHGCRKVRRLRRTMAELGEADEAELQRLVAAEQQKAQFTAQVHHFMELCWDKCVEKPGNRLDSRTENCLSSCVDRFIDTTLAITSRFAQIVQKGGQ